MVCVYEELVGLAQIAHVDGSASLEMAMPDFKVVANQSFGRSFAPPRNDMDAPPKLGSWTLDCKARPNWPPRTLKIS